MRIRPFTVAAVVAALPLSLAACGGGASVEDFCAQYEAIDQIQSDETDQAKAELEELSDVVPDEAGDEVQEAVDLMAELFPADGDLEGAVTSGELSEEDAQEFLTAAGTVTGYGDENCS